MGARRGWTGGDFNYDGQAGFADLGLLLNTYDSSGLSGRMRSRWRMPAKCAEDERCLAGKSSKAAAVKDGVGAVEFAAVGKKGEDEDVSGEQWRGGGAGGEDWRGAEGVEGCGAAGFGAVWRGVGYVYGGDGGEGEQEEEDDSD